MSTVFTTLIYALKYVDPDAEYQECTSLPRSQPGFLPLYTTCGSYGVGSPTAVVCSRDLVSCVGTGELYAVIEWIPAAM